MNITTLPQELQKFINDVQQLRDYQKRYFVATTKNTPGNDQRFELLKECKKRECQIDQDIQKIKNQYQQLEAF
jgi:hypothetical protein